METKTKPLIIERTFDAPVSKVWQAITDNSKMKQWYFNLDAFKPEVGFEFQFTGQGHKGEQYIHLCRITEVITEKKLTYSWKYKDYPGESFVSFELFPEGNKTRLVLTHKGLDSFPSDSPDFAVESFNEGWNIIIGKNLKEFVEKN
jgi:uncharacterized protein YndB with AHSA1/START domain